MITKRLLQLILQIHFAFRAFQQKHEPDFAYWQARFVPLSPPWQKLQSLNQTFQWICINLLIISALISIYFPLAYEFQLPYRYPIIGFLSLIFSGLGFYFFRFQQKGKQWLHTFSDEVEQRLQTNQSLNLTNQQNKIFHNHLIYNNLAWIKFIVLLFSLDFMSVYIYQEIKRQALTKPEHLTAQMQKSIQIHQKAIDKLQKTIAYNRKALQMTEVKIKVNQQLMNWAQFSLREQSGGLGQSFGFSYTLQHLKTKINEALAQSQGSSSRAEAMIRTDPHIWQQIKGLVEVRLSIADEEIGQAETKLNQEGELLKSFQDLAYIYQRMLEKAQKGIGLDNHKIKKLRAEIEWNQCLQEKLKSAIQQDSSLIEKNLKNIQSLKTNLQNRKSLKIKKGIKY